MPKQSKIKSSKPPKAAPVKEEPEKYYCTRCTRSFKAQRNNFPASQSPLFRENNKYLPVCRNCINELFDFYKDYFNDEKQALRRICLKFDIYWDEEIYKMIYKKNTTQSRVLSYISKTNLNPFQGKTFDDTLDNEAQMFGYNATADANGTSVLNTEDLQRKITDEMIDFWGTGFSPIFYLELEKRWQYWCGDRNKDDDSPRADIVEAALYKQICMLEATIAQDSAAGKSIDKNINALNNLLGSMNIKPVQTSKGDALSADIEQIPFGKWLQKIEMTEPIPEPSPEFKDVDGIIKYITVWFFGHMCKMLNIKNKYSRLYEEEMALLRVERPEYEGDDDENIMEDIFERASASNTAQVGDADD